jgi:hypothetical protein
MPSPGSVSERRSCHYEGTAYASADGHVAYREEHFVYVDRDGVRTRLVLYRCPSGEPFARKIVREAPSDTAPDFELFDARSGYREGVRTTAGHREVFVQDSRDAAERAAEVPERPDLVIDAGFDAFVRDDWNELDTPEGGHMTFVVPSRLGSVEMRVRASSQGVLNGRPVRQLRLGLSAWYGIAAPTIDLSYSSPDHVLRRFTGRSNILDASHNSQDVRIEFPPSAEFPAPSPQDVDRATTLPLVTNCEEPK